MPCFRPLKGYRAKSVNPNGKRSIVFSPLKAYSVLPEDMETLPCGQCIYCRLEHSRNAAIRCSHEASLYESNCFLTLTYSPKHLPAFGSLDYDAPVKFMKDLRKVYGPGIRSYGCAEYGSEFTRPHYHLCIFNHDFSDKVLWSNRDDNPLYTSKALSDLWPLGHSTIGDLTFESAAYVARYVTKKITGRRAESHYETHDPKTGEIFTRPPERSICVSRMPGIGREWLEKNARYILNNDFIISRGKRVRPPKYYDRLLEKLYPNEFAIIKAARREQGEVLSEKLIAEDHQAMIEFFKNHDHEDQTPKTRLNVMEDVQELKAKQLIRGLENG
ncbi:MAG: replication initiator protein [Microvirus sp.]|nr:MAG: replication initiator protein [Microvirus sp.]